MTSKFLRLLVMITVIAAGLHPALAADLPKVRQVEVVAKAIQTITIQWKKVAQARSYQVRVLQRNGDHWEQIRVLTDIQQANKRIRKLAADTRYRIQVRAVHKAERGPWSTYLAVKTKPAAEEEPVEETEEEEDASDQTDCVSNQAPDFTDDITDINLVSQIIQPPSTGTGGLKTHAFMYTDLERVPVYAPADVSLTSGAFYLETNEGGEYLLLFDVTCEITFRFDHITEPADAIVAAFSDEPQEGTQTTQLAEPIEFLAGDLIGYTTGTIYGVWDFGLYNSEVANQFSDDPDYNTSEVYTTAICPFDFFGEDQRTIYYDLFAKTEDQLPEGASEFCVL